MKPSEILSDIPGTLAKLESLLRDGRGREVREVLSRWPENKTPRRYLSTLANLAWRANLPGLGIGLLHAVVRPPHRVASHATAPEKAEYAVCLVKNGAWEEGRQLLENTSPDEYAQVFLYRSFPLVAQWDYPGSIPLLESYLAQKTLTAYQRLVGEVNLAAALVEGRDERKTTPLLRSLVYKLSLPRYHLLLGRVLEISAENFLRKGNWKQAEGCLEKSEELLAQSEGIDLFFVRKFRAVSALLQKPSDKSALAGVREVRAEAIQRQHWNTVRDLDRIEARCAKNEELWNRVYFGTPFPSFREQMQAESPGLSLRVEYLWKFDSGKGPVLDVENGVIDGGPSDLKQGQAVHRLLLVLASDLYRPFRTAALFGALHPDEFFNPASSPTRVRQSVKRLRHWFESKKLPFLIQELEGSYRLSSVKPCTLKIRLKRQLTRHEHLLETLRASMPGSFSAKEAGDLWDLSSRAALRVLESGILAGILIRSGTRRGSTYQFVPTASSKKAS